MQSVGLRSPVPISKVDPTATNRPTMESADFIPLRGGAPKRKRTESLAILTKVISGGQRGADRGALEAAKRAGLATGGWIPRGFRTSDGSDPSLGERFGLREIPVPQTSSAGAYIARSQRNVESADATLAFRMTQSRGTDRTIGYAQSRRWIDGKIPNKAVGEAAASIGYRPCLVVTKLEPRATIVAAIVAFIRRHRVHSLNVAGHRQTTAPYDDFEAKIGSLLDEVFAALADAE